MSKIKNILVLSISFLMMSTATFAQNGSAKDSTVLIINSGFQPFLTDAFKIKDNPSIKDTGKIIPKLKYSFLDKQIPVGFNIDPIKAAKIKGEPLKKLYRGYTKVGFGTNTTPLAEIYYNAKRSKTFNYGFFGKHFSSTGIAKNDYSGFSDNHLSFFGKHYSREFTTTGKVGYTRNVNHYYGLSNLGLLNEELDSILVNENTTEQKLDKFDVGFSLARNFTDSSEFDYNVDVDFHHLKDKFTVSENHLELAGN
ncbi:MAG: hypothetical protein ACPGSO_07830, partial [Vicingaceae bacterium]